MKECGNGPTLFLPLEANNQTFFPVSFDLPDPILPLVAGPLGIKQGSPGVVFTKSWVVEVVLDLAGYTQEKPLANLVALEPSAGDGAFLREMTRRLVKSCKLHGISLAKATGAIRAYEIDPVSAESARQSIFAELDSLDVPHEEAQSLAKAWVVCGDFLEASLGFPVADFVVGNPPYIRLEDLTEGKNALYRSSFDTMRGRADIYIAFYQAALTQLKPSGVCAFICADRWLLNEYGANLRALISEYYAVQYIIDVHDVDAFEEAVAAYPSITVIRHSKQKDVIVAKALPEIENQDPKEIVRHIQSGQAMPSLRVSKFEKWFEGAEPWTCSSQGNLDVLKYLEKNFELLESDETKTKVGIGVATGADKVFITRHIADVEEDRLLPLGMGKNLDASEVVWCGHYLINPWNKEGLVDLEKYPKLKAYFEAHREVLAARHTAKAKPTAWFKTIDRVNLDLVEKDKLYIGDIKNRLIPCLDTGKTYPHHNVYWITSEGWDLRVLGAILMSEVGEFFIRCYGVKMRGGYFRFQAQYLRKIRVPNPKKISKNMAQQLVIAFNTRDQQMATQLALELYGITSIPQHH